MIANTEYEGHPPAWHLLLWTASNISRSPVTAQVVGAACVSAAAWLVLRYCPFTLPVRVLLIAGYYPFYEMGVVTRSYALMFLLVVVSLVLGDRRPVPIWPLVVTLALMSWTLALGVPVAIALAVGMAVRHRYVASRRLVAAGVVFAASTVLAVQVARPKRSDGRRLRVEPGDIEEARRVFAAPVRVVLPWFARAR